MFHEKWFRFQKLFWGLFHGNDFWGDNMFCIISSKQELLLPKPNDAWGYWDCFHYNLDHAVRSSLRMQPAAIQWAKRTFGAASAKRALRWGGICVRNMRELVDKKLLRLPGRLRSLYSAPTPLIGLQSVAFARRSNHRWELGKTLRVKEFSLNE